MFALVPGLSHTGTKFLLVVRGPLGIRRLCLRDQLLNIFYCSRKFYCFSMFCTSTLEQSNGQAVPWLRSLVAGLSPRRPGFAPGSIHVEFVVDRFFSEFFGFPLSIYHSTVALQTHDIWEYANVKAGIHAWVLDPPHLQENDHILYPHFS
jgi:hypothetical protein